MERVRWENYKGRTILIVDYSGLKADVPDEKKTMLATIKQAQETAANQSSPILFLSIATDGQADGEAMSALKAFAKFTADNGLVDKECVVGITRIQRVLLSAVNFFSSGNLQPFPTIEEAREWLVS